MHPFRFGIQCRGPVDPAGWPALARQVEDLGWSTLTIADHFDEADRFHLSAWFEISRSALLSSCQR